MLCPIGHRSTIQTTFPEHLIPVGKKLPDSHFWNSWQSTTLASVSFTPNLMGLDKQARGIGILTKVKAVFSHRTWLLVHSLSNAFAVLSANDLVCILRSLTTPLRQGQSVKARGWIQRWPRHFLVSLNGRLERKPGLRDWISPTLPKGRCICCNTQKCLPSAVSDSRDGQKPAFGFMELSWS